MIVTRGVFAVLAWIFCNISVFHCQEIDKPRGPWQLAFKVVSGKWNPAVTGHPSFWDLFESTDTYNTANPVADQRDFSTSSDHYKSELVQQWEDGYISVQVIKLSLFKNNKEKAYIVFDAIGKTKTTWFKCDNILYSSYPDLPDNTLPTECPGKNAMGLPLTMMKLSYFFAYCPDTTGWLVVADTDFSFSLCPNYMPADGSEPKPYFKYSNLTSVADLSTELETADSIGIFFQVWDMVFKGVEGIKPSTGGLNNLTGLFMSDITENDKSDLNVRNLRHSQSSQIFKSDVINLWDYYFIDTVKFSMLKSGTEKAYVVFDGTNSDKMSWFTDYNLLYSSYGSSLDGSLLEMCSIEGDGYRNWQIQSLAYDLGCSDTEQMGWMLVKEPRNNGTCSWDTSSIKKKPYFLYNTGTVAASPSTFQYADVIAVFVHGWRMVLKISASGSLAPKSSVYSLWSDPGGMNEYVDEATSMASLKTFKSSIIDQWTSFYIRAIKIAAYKDGLEVFNAVFDATASNNTNWLDCSRLLSTSVSGLTSTTANTNSYTCSLQGNSSTFRFFLGKSPDCGTVSATGMFMVVDADSTCSSRNDLPQFLYSNTIGSTLSEMTELQLADAMAIFVDMANCYSDTCLNGATCQDLGGNFRCFCTGNYFGETCANINGTYGAWSTWSECSVTCSDGIQSRNRTCVGAEGVGTCDGNSVETMNCTLDPCPIDGGYTEWITWTTCTVTCGTGTRSRSRDCTNPAPQFGGSNCSEPSTESENCNTTPCPIDGGLTEWTDWSDCSVTCETGNQSRERSCTNPTPQYGGLNCEGEIYETNLCVLGSCPINGGYTEWSEWTTCTLTCGGGEQSRSRECTNPVPQFGGLSCQGYASETVSCNTDNCPINGGYSEWSEWTTCTVTCGGGEQFRSRECTNPLPQYGGLLCQGNASETVSCNTENCPINGGYTEWSIWTTCTLTCGGGEQSRSRECTNPVPEYGGLSCKGTASETVSCNTDNCPIYGGYSEWSEWTTCTLTCGGGEQFRSRECINPLPQYGGLSCQGNASETVSCNTENCPINGGYTEWSEWTTCTLTCGGGSQSRSRECTNPVPEYVGLSCQGNASETVSCNTDNCPINGGYTEWSDWTTCTLTCGGGEQSRTRECTNPVPEYGGLSCKGNASETVSCNTDNCPINGGYTEWSEWTTCTLTCGGGEQFRSRECINPLPQYGGLSCQGNASETVSCNTDNCPINGGYTEWSEWTTCTLTCGGGSQSRSRECTNPVPEYGGLSCQGNASESVSCNTDNCPINGGYTEWSDWTTCTLTCGGGEQSRSRECTNPVPQFGGISCQGNASEAVKCNKDNCPINGGYTEWSEWTTCTLTCGGGSQSRSRECTNPVPQYGGLLCQGDASETVSCYTDNCPINGGYTEWSEWTTCTLTCGGGEQFRSRECTNPLPQYGGLPCAGDFKETVSCNTDNCPINGGNSEWSEWTACTLTCGGGSQSRSRECTNPIPQYGGLSCQGNASETVSCNTENCPINGGYTEWSIWTTCTLTCGGGEQSRFRECTNPLPQYGGLLCQGNGSETVNCNLDNCPINGGYTEWSEWTTCTLTCGAGEQFRSRECIKPLPQYGGLSCQGNASETISCNTDNCPINGGYTEWSEWTTCTLTCGAGEQFRSRECTNPVPQYEGLSCQGNASEAVSCNKENCPINGGFTEWSEWTACTLTCSGGLQSRFRECTNPAPQFGGFQCPGSANETVGCNTDNCPINGGYTEWSEWTACSLTCGGGKQSRHRSCINPIPQYGGLPCAGEQTETLVCGDINCPVHGGFSEWTLWSPCSATCGAGQQVRSRDCNSPSPEFGGDSCFGEFSEKRDCNEDLCPDELGFSLWSEVTSCSNICVDGGYTPWTEWSPCSVSCGVGETSRSRECSNPKPQYAGAYCDGVSMETLICSSECPIDGGFTEWTEWTDCSATCGEGEKTRSRSCLDPLPQFGGDECTGHTEETQTCNLAICLPVSIDGGFSNWSDWTECSMTCGGGEQTRSRTCTKPEPQNGGNDCLGEFEETRICSTESCPPVSIDGGFSDWSDWTGCSVSCGGGEQTRNRTCSNPEPQNGGKDCVGDSEETRTCGTDSCPPEKIDGSFSDWSDWTECSLTCGGGEQTRSRTCSNPEPQNDGNDCVGDLEETQTCGTDNCPSVDGGFTDWTTWTECSVTCGDGQQTRSRECTNPVPQFGGNDCEGSREGIKVCNLASCPVNGGFTAWNIWSECSVTCGNGTRIRSRDCSDPEPQHGGEDCVGDTEESETCELDPCPVDGYWLSWDNWTPCSELCGGGSRERTRACVDPLHGGNSCDGAGKQIEFCNTQECPFDGVWSVWSSWGDCNATCEGGIRERTRMCIGPLNGGAECTGISRATEICNDTPCPVDGHWASWNEWSTCTVTCNTGTRERTRDCIDPQYGGKNCTGAAIQTTFCNTYMCAVDGEWRNWSEWNICSVSCGGGSRDRSRTCIEPLYGGLDCIGNATDYESCNEEACPVNGYWLEWSEWDACSVSCADGTRNRTRSCVEPLYGGANCTGETSQTEYCNNGNCPIDGYWSDWSKWTKCSQTCGGGYRNKSRDCNEPLYGGLMCQGEMSETDTCNVDACPINGEWLEWSPWSTCSKTCGGGTSVKTRNCTEPKYGGKFCEGESSETDMCNVDPCAVDGYLEEWSEWTECSVSCAGGVRNRTRACVQPKFGGKECTGVRFEEEECNVHGCPVDGIWITWSQWSECSSTCNGGARNRSRTCTGTKHGGKFCDGRDVDIQICALEACPSIDGGWSVWTGWTACSMSCGFSERTRNRTCTNPSPQWGGKYCEGIHIQSESCKENDCPVDGLWTSWTTWSPCLNKTVNGVSSPKCGRGSKYRNRTCDNPAPQFNGSDCTGISLEIMKCNIPCHSITCSKENPEKCQIVFHNVPDNKGLKVTTSTYVVIAILCTLWKLFV